MATVWTPDLPICFFSVSSTGKITIRFCQPYQSDLFLGLATITENPNIVGVTGTFKAGTDAMHGGTATLQADSTVFARLAAFLSNHTGLVMDLCYDSVTLLFNEIICGSTQPSLATEETLEALRVAVGNGVLTDSVNAIYTSAQMLLETVKRFAPFFKPELARLDASAIGGNKKKRVSVRPNENRAR